MLDDANTTSSETVCLYSWLFSHKIVAFFLSREMGMCKMHGEGGTNLDLALRCRRREECYDRCVFPVGFHATTSKAGNQRLLGWWDRRCWIVLE